jgi:inosine-uridine nucleoside N-ribohydrolase/formylmethanofuran dehydrogenase subunit E
MFRGIASSALTIAALLLGPAFAGFAHEASRSPVIVDTDMALDDARALALLARAPGLELVAVLTSDGGSSPCEGASRVHRLLDELDRGGVPVGVGAPLSAPDPPWREMGSVLDAFGSAEAPACEALPEALALARKELERSHSPVTWVALGPMTNLASLLERHPDLENRLHAVYYSGDQPDAEPVDWNTARDRDAAASILAAEVPIYLVPPRDAEAALVLDASLMEAVAEFDSPAAEWISRLYADERVQRLMADGHAGPWDDIAALALLEPSSFESMLARTSPPLRRLVPRPAEAVRHALLSVLAADEGLKARPNVVLSRFPTEPAALRDDVAEVAGQIQKRHGAEEWKAALLANELHRHLGIYSLVGVKMGIRARELLDASLDELRVESHAGLRPPMSCLTDGLQAATGASLGRGTIRVEGNDPGAKAVFAKGGARLHLVLKDEVRSQIRSDVATAVARFGNLTPQYFDEIRRLSIRYWLTLDRREIFEERVEAEP